MHLIARRLFQWECTGSILQDRTSEARLFSQVYRGMLDAGRGVVKNQGIRGLYSGLSVTLVEIVPYAALQFGLYDLFTAAAAKRHANSPSADVSRRRSLVPHVHSWYKGRGPDLLRMLCNESVQQEDAVKLSSEVNVLAHRKQGGGRGLYVGWQLAQLQSSAHILWTSARNDFRCTPVKHLVIWNRALSVVHSS